VTALKFVNRSRAGRAI